MQILAKAVILIIFLTCVCPCSAQPPPKPFLRSPFYLEFFAETEILFVKELQERAWDIKTPLRDQVLAYLQIHKLETENLHVDGDGDSGLNQKVLSITSNPISMFQLVHRWINQLCPIRAALIESKSIRSGNYDRENLQTLEHYEGFTTLDLNASMTDILNICHVYDLDISLLVEGVMLGNSIGTQLNADHCFQLGTFGRLKGYHAFSIQFYEEALGKNGSYPKEMIQEVLSNTIKEHDEIVGNTSLHPYSKQYLFHRPLAHLIQQYGEKHKIMRMSQRMLVAQMSAEEIRDHPQKIESHDVPFAYDICLHKNLQSEAERSSLFCWYEFWTDPYFTVNPLKMELLSSKPELVQIYEMISPGQIRRIKESVRSSSHKNTTEPSGYNTRYVESVTDMHEIRILPLEHKVLSLFQAWGPGRVVRNQIHSYTPGSSFKIHMDTGTEFLKPQTGTSVSILYYLEAPVLGGETVFLYPRITVTAAEGSGIFWLNNVVSGWVDKVLHHGSCPLLMGRKTVVAKYLKPRRPPPKRECTTHYFEKFKHFPRSKVLNQKFYPKLRTYFENENNAYSQWESDFLPPIY